MKLFLSKHNVSSTNLVYHTYTNTFLPGVPMVVHTYPVISTNMEDLQSIACGLFMRFVLQKCEAQTTDVHRPLMLGNLAFKILCARLLCLSVSFSPLVSSLLFKFVKDVQYP